MGEATINGLIEGGKATAGPPLGPALGPLGVNTAKIIAELNAQTSAYAGIKVPIKIIVDTATKSYKIEIGSPPTSALVCKELGIQKGAKGKEEVAGNMTLEQVRNVANAADKKLYGNTLSAKMAQVIGTCESMNVTVEGTNAKEFMKKVKSGEVKLA
ncbi:50S ribosomal protein L11 [uncultured archaeon]|nr:50S ribosomal protein L11 [uncultured archaeon]